MTGWLAATTVVGKWIIICSGGTLLLTVLALAIYVLRKGTPSDADVKPTMRPFGARAPMGQTGAEYYKGFAKLKVLFNRESFITMESLVDGTATREEWAVVIGVQIAFVSFWFVFLGAALMKLEDSNGLSLFFPAVVGLWLYAILSAQWRDWKKARRKLARAAKQPRP